LKVRERIQNGYGRGFLTVVVPLAVFCACLYWWPADLEVQKRWLDGLQKLAFVAAAFTVTTNSLRTRIVDFVLKSEGKLAVLDEFRSLAIICGRRLTDLLLLFTITAAWLGSLALFAPGTLFGEIATGGALALFSSSIVAFVYIVFSFERLERFALDEAEANAHAKEVARPFQNPAS
jgi:hypothetical protein